MLHNTSASPSRASIKGNNHHWQTAQIIYRFGDVFQWKKCHEQWKFSFLIRSHQHFHDRNEQNKGDSCMTGTYYYYYYLDFFFPCSKVLIKDRKKRQIMFFINDAWENKFVYMFVLYFNMRHSKDHPKEERARWQLNTFYRTNKICYLYEIIWSSMAANIC